MGKHTYTYEGADEVVLGVPTDPSPVKPGDTVTSDVEISHPHFVAKGAKKTAAKKDAPEYGDTYQ